MFFGALLIAAAALLFVALRTPRVWVLDIGASGDAPFVERFFERENRDGQTYRWSRPDARIVPHGAYAGPATLELQMFSDRATYGVDPRLNLIRAERVWGSFDVAPGWRVYRVLLPGGALESSGAGAAALMLEHPAYYATPGDARERGVAIDRIRVLPLERLPTPIARPLFQALLLAWMLALAIGGLWFLDRIAAPQSTARAATIRVGALATGLAVGLAFWAWRDPGMLMWALPVTPLILVLATAGLGVLFTVAGTGKD